jgi:hypothetical protein
VYVGSSTVDTSDHNDNKRLKLEKDSLEEDSDSGSDDKQGSDDSGSDNGQDLNLVDKESHLRPKMDLPKIPELKVKSSTLNGNPSVKSVKGSTSIEGLGDENQWYMKYSILKSISLEGNQNIPATFLVTGGDGTTIRLGLWLKKQRQMKKECVLRPHRQALMQELVDTGIHIYIYVYVYKYIYIYVYIYVFIYIYLLVYIFKSKHMYTFVSRLLPIPNPLTLSRSLNMEFK